MNERETKPPTVAEAVDALQARKDSVTAGKAEQPRRKSQRDMEITDVDRAALMCVNFDVGAGGPEELVKASIICGGVLAGVIAEAGSYTLSEAMGAAWFEGFMVRAQLERISDDRRALSADEHPFERYRDGSGFVRIPEGELAELVRTGAWG